MRRFLSIAAASALAAAGIAACDFDQIRAEKAMVATVLAIPDVSFSPGAGLDAGFDAGQVTVPGQTVSTVFFGERDNGALDEPPSPIAGANVTIGWSGASTVTLSDKGQGNYAITSAESSSLEYVSGATYQFTARHGGASYVGQVENAPQLEHVPELHPAQGFIDHPAGAPFTFTRPSPPAGQERNLGLITVYPVSDQGQKGEPTWTNMPKTPLEFLELVVRPSQWKTTTVTVPGSAFPQANQTYVLVLQAVKSGGPQSDNLFTGSAILAGTAEIGVFRTR